MPSTRSASARVWPSPCRARYSPSTGTNACANAPSPTRRRSRFGMRKATKKASVRAPAPKVTAMRTSRTKPEIRDSSVMALTEAAAFSRFTRSGPGLCFIWTSGVSYQASLGHPLSHFFFRKLYVMANSKQAAKRAKKSVKQRSANMSLRTTLRSAIKKVQKAIASGDAKAAEATLRAEQSTIDAIADKRIIHKNKAARHKSRLAHQVKALANRGA